MSLRATIPLPMIAALSAAAAPNATAQAWQSEIVYYGDDGLLVYESDADGNRIPDFSGVGYGGGRFQAGDFVSHRKLVHLR